MKCEYSALDKIQTEFCIHAKSFDRRSKVFLVKRDEGNQSPNIISR